MARFFVLAAAVVVAGCGGGSGGDPAGPGECVSAPTETCAEATYGATNVCNAQPRTGYVVCCCWTDSGATTTSLRPIDAGRD